MKEIKIYWTLQRLEDFRGPDSVRKHQIRRARSGDGRTYHIGGLGYKEELFTRVICPDGQLVCLRPETDVIHLAVVGGVNGDYRYCNTLCTDQLRALANEFRSICHSFGEVELDCSFFHHFNFERWVAAIGAARHITS